jgi:hypothetical protein
VNNLTYNFKAPALPLPPVQYDSRYHNQYNNVLRIYFNQLDNLLRELVASSGPYGIFASGSAGDAFGRLRASQPYTIFDSQNRYAQSGDFSETTATGGSSTYLPNESSVQLDVTTSSGSEVVRQSYRVFPYQPGKSLLVMNTFVFGAGQSNLRQRVGYFSTQNGVFLELDGTTLYFVKRSYVTGSVVDTRVAQTDWNTDKLNGTGNSGFTLDITKSQIFWQDFEWLGVGSVRCGFVIDGQLIIAHVFQNANVAANVYMTTATLPIRYEITATAGIGSAASMKQICSTVVSEGGYERKVAATVARMTTATTVGTSFEPLVSIQLNSSRLDSVIIPFRYNALPTGSADYEIALIKNATLTGASFVASDSPNADYDVSATALSGGTIVRTDYVASTNQASAQLDSDLEYNFDLQLGRTIGGTSDIYTLAARVLSGTDPIIGSLEFYDLT